jgi:hypothetical protein
MPDQSRKGGSAEKQDHPLQKGRRLFDLHNLPEEVRSSSFYA